MRVRAGVYKTDSAIPEAITRKLAKAPEITALWYAQTPADLQAAVRSGQVDVGIAIEKNQSVPLQITIIADATRNGATTIAQGALSRQLKSDITAETQMTFVNPVNNDKAMAAYFVAGVSMLFLLLSGFQSSLGLIEDRDAGVIERLAASPHGIRPLILSKFIFIALQGCAQISIILLAGLIFFSVDPFYQPIYLLLAIIAASISAAGFCLGVTSLCGSRNQAHAMGTVLALIFSAIGGSMAPRFLMPPGIQKIGHFTINAQGIDALAVSLWQGGGLAVISPSILCLLGVGLFGLTVALLRFPKSLA